MSVCETTVNRLLDVVLRLNEKAFEERECCGKDTERYFRLSGEILGYSKVCAQLIELGDVK